MIDLQVLVYEHTPATRVSSAAELDHAIRMAGDEARAQGMLNVIFIEAANGNRISMVVGADETILGFTFDHLGPPYYASRYSEATTDPLMTCYVALVHHTEFPRQYVVPIAGGLAAVHQFAASGDLPTCIAWLEI